MTVIYVIVALVTGFSLFDYYVNRNWEAITSVSRNEAVFAHRNRAYGAYVLRSGYNKRMTLILAGMVAFAALAFTVSFIIKNLPKEEIKKPRVSEKNFTIAPPKDDVPPPPPPTTPPPPPMTETQAFIAPVAEDDYVEDELPSQAELNNTTISTETNEGDDTWGLANTQEEGPALTDVPDQVEAVVDVAEEDAEFPGGYDKLNAFINATINYPDEALELGVKGRVVVRFVVEKDGRISNASVERPIVECPACNKEALNIINKMPNWTPAKNAGRPVRLWVRVPIIYDTQ
jgi:periplasmic protein TonB